MELLGHTKAVVGEHAHPWGRGTRGPPATPVGARGGYNDLKSNVLIAIVNKNNNSSKQASS